MDAQSRIKITIGDLFVQLALAQERIEELEKQLDEKPQEQHSGGNGQLRRPASGGDRTLADEAPSAPR